MALTKQMQGIIMVVVFILTALSTSALPPNTPAYLKEAIFVIGLILVYLRSHFGPDGSILPATPAPPGQ